MHPGRQPEHRGPGPKQWNTIDNDHRRSFLIAAGYYCLDTSGSPVGPRELIFWGEWEPPADVRGVGPHPTNVLFSPRFPIFPGRSGLHNTDPFVFDGEFLYCCCKQVRKNGTVTFLRNLDPGDVVLFGSHVSGTFVLDTVFVVGQRSCLYRPSLRSMELDKQVAHSFVEATLKPLANQSPGQKGDGMQPAGSLDEADPEDNGYGCSACAPLGSVEYRLYWGVTPDKPLRGSFSFVPAAIADKPIPWFDRLDIGEFEFIQKDMKSGFRDCHYPAAEGWTQVAKRTLEAGLVLGTQFQLRK